jgi:uncharacterized membrane protein YgdD (TMEM256/DUF423 family)
MPPYLLLSGFLGLLAVALGAFGAHALRPVLLERGLLDAWQTAVLYHLVHAVALLAIALKLSPADAGAPPRAVGRLRAACLCWLIGIVLFSGSLYLLAGLDLKVPWFITPLGGVALLCGWACVAWAGWPRSSRAER